MNNDLNKSNAQYKPTLGELVFCFFFGLGAGGFTWMLALNILMDAKLSAGWSLFLWAVVVIGPIAFISVIFKLTLDVRKEWKAKKLSPLCGK